MMEEIGIVRDVEGQRAHVVVTRRGSCEGCAAGAACKADGDAKVIEALNEARARPGDRVRVFFKPYTYVKGSLLLYGIPALALIIGAVAGKSFLSGMFREMDPELVAAGAAFGLCLAAVVAVRFISRRLEKKTELMPVITEIMKSC